MEKTDIKKYPIKFGYLIIKEYEARMQGSEVPNLKEIHKAFSNLKVVVNRKSGNNTYEILLALEDIATLSNDIEYWLYEYRECQSEGEGDYRAEIMAFTSALKNCRKILTQNQ
jgi:hypothetical protein